MKKEVMFNPELLARQPPDLAIVGIAGCGRALDAELSRQKEKGLVSEFGDVVIDGTLIKPGFLYALERTEATLKAIEAGFLIDHGFSIPSGWISTPDGRIVKP